MKSKIAEFWDMLCSEDELIQDEGQCKRKQFFNENTGYFQNVIEELPGEFVQIYSEINFHDFQILSTSINSSQDKNVAISLYLYDYYSINVNDTKNRLNWAYDIFERSENNRWIHRIMCSDANNIVISFSRISIKQRYLDAAVKKV